MWNKITHGFSLIELMVIVGMLAGLSLVVMNISKQSAKSSSKYQFDSEIMLITNEINGILSDPNKCLTTFTNATQAASPATPTVPTANITNPTGIAGIPSTVRKYTLAGGPYGNGGVVITSYLLDLAATPDPLLIINFQKKSILGSGTTPKTIKLYVEKTAAGIVSLCRSMSTASVDIWSHGSGTDINYIGYVGIGTVSPNANLEVVGEVKVGNSGIACSGTNKGAQRYNAGSDMMEYCSGTGWKPIGGNAGTLVNMYKCPGPVSLGGGLWGFYGCQNQITNQSTCYEVEYPTSATFSCTYVGKMTLAP